MILRHTWFALAQKFKILFSGREILSIYQVYWHVTSDNGQGVIAYTVREWEHDGGRGCIKVNLLLQPRHLKGFKEGVIEGIGVWGQGDKNADAEITIDTGRTFTYVVAEDTVYYHNRYPVVFSTVKRGTTSLSILLGFTTVLSFLLTYLMR